jgi:hypothetical protein
VLVTVLSIKGFPREFLIIWTSQINMDENLHTVYTDCLNICLHFRQSSVHLATEVMRAWKSSKAHRDKSCGL